jgi:3-dehydroquinate dehydratase-2
MGKMAILIVNGPNLGHLGKRQPEIYGTEGMDAVPGLVGRLLGEAKAENVALDFYQSNSEGELIDRLERAKEEGVDGLVVNAGAYTHTSLALGDCLAWIKLPCVEVHLSNLAARKDEPVRRKSYVGPHCLGVIAGFGILGYALAVQALVERSGS